MPLETPLTLPDDLSFETAIAVSQSLLDQMEQQALAEADLEAVLTQLVRSENGARGFFVTYLSDERSLADSPSPAIIQALKTSPDTVAPLMVKNLAMSTASAIAHRRNQDATAAQGSDRVQRRSTQLLQAIQSPTVEAHVAALATSLDTGAGDYAAFLDRWGYDTEQRQVIRQQLAATNLLA